MATPPQNIDDGNLSDDNYDSGTDNEDEFSCNSDNHMSSSNIADENGQSSQSLNIIDQNNALPTLTDRLDTGEDYSQNVLDAEETVDKEKKKRKNSLAHSFIVKKKAVFISFDLEHGGNECGITQLSAQLFRLGGLSKDDMKRDAIVDEVFNEYVKPPPSANWNQSCIDTTGLHRDHKDIQSALSIAEVWKKFEEYINRNISSKECGILIAWNGGSCDLDWIYKLTQLPCAKLSFPTCIRFFLDPLACIRRYKSCKFHPSHSKLDSLSLASVYGYAKETPLTNAHNSLIDAMGQTEIVMHLHFRRVFSMKGSMRHLSEMFDAKDKRRIAREMEPTRPVHGNWKADDNAEDWEPRAEQQYFGRYGPRQHVINMGMNEDSGIEDIFFLYAPVRSIWKKISHNSDKYANKESVVLDSTRKDRDGNPYKKKFYKVCSKQTVGARHRQVGPRMWEITTGLTIAWHGILMYHGAHANDNMPILAHWGKRPYGNETPFVMNTISKNAFECMRRFLHLADNSKQKVKNRKDPKYDPLFKVRWAMERLMKNLSLNWSAGKRVCIDEGMIKYMGRGIYFVQYMPRKPIKHGIKVFALCCGYTGHLLSFEIYLGKRGTDTSEQSALSIVDRLITVSGINDKKGRILYTDNWYTSAKLACHLFRRYRWLFVGTLKLTDKKDRADYDIPFLNLSKGALDNVPRGWARRATIRIRGHRKDEGVLQCTVWKDKKLVGFLHTHKVEGVTGIERAKRHVKGEYERVEISCPPVQIDYKNFFNAVDRKDRDTADYSISIRTNRWYLRIWFWIIDGVIHAVYLCVCQLAEDGIRPDWVKYRDKHNGRRRFQIDLALALMEFGIRYEWGDVTDISKRPKWMRQASLIPCNCEVCFFCREGLTHGIDHANIDYRKRQCGRKRKLYECSGDREHLLRSKVSQSRSGYCRPCYRKRRNFVEQNGLRESSDGTKAHPCVRKVQLGCIRCREFVCKYCWEDYDHPNNQTKQD